MSLTQKIAKTFGIIGISASSIACGSGGGSSTNNKNLQLNQTQPKTPTQTSTPSCIELDLTQVTPLNTTEIPADFLGPLYGNSFSELVVEIDYDTRTPPSQRVIDDFLQKISERSRVTPINVKIYQILDSQNNPARIHCNYSDVSGSELEKTATLVRKENTVFPTSTLNGKLTLQILYLEEPMTDPMVRTRKFGGYTFGNSAFAVLDATSRSQSELVGILTHHFGHVIGQVDRGTPITSAHQTLDGSHHCITPACIMNDVAAPNAGDFCTPCKNDLYSNGGK